MSNSYKKKPVVIEAVQFVGNNDAEVAEFIGFQGYDPVDNKPSWVINTLEGDMTVSVGDWIIKGVKGEFYPCKPDIFELTYEVDDPTYVSDEWQDGYNEGYEDGIEYARENP